MSWRVLPSAPTAGIVGFVAGHLLDDYAIDEVAVLGVARALQHLAHGQGPVPVVGRPERDRIFECDHRRVVSRRGVSDEDIGGALIAARCAIVTPRADHDRFPADRHRQAELVNCRRVRGLQFLLLAPDSTAARKDIGRALALPAAPSSNGAPTTTVSPLIATEQPKMSSTAASEASSFACCIQARPLRTKT